MDGDRRMPMDKESKIIGEIWWIYKRIDRQKDRQTDRQTDKSSEMRRRTRLNQGEKINKDKRQIQEGKRNIHEVKVA